MVFQETGHQRITELLFQDLVWVSQIWIPLGMDKNEPGFNDKDFTYIKYLF
jgi:hypothetical protein